MKSKFQFPLWINRQVIAQIILVILFLAVCIWISIQPNPFDPANQPPPPSEGQQKPPDQTQIKLSATAYQLEIEENRDQTTGIVLGGSMLVVLIVGCTLLIIKKK
jgi:hypothetical protein